MRTRHVFAALIAASLMGMSSRVEAAIALRCADATTVFDGLKKENGEVPYFTGITAAGGDVMITVGPSGSWTMVLNVNGRLCMLAAGDLIKTEGAPKPEPNNLPAAPALLEHGILLIRQ